MIKARRTRPRQSDRLSPTLTDWCSTKDKGRAFRQARSASHHRHTARDHLTEAKISCPFHPQFAESVVIRRRLVTHNVERAVIVQPDGSLACLPAWMPRQISGAIHDTRTPNVLSWSLTVTARRDRRASSLSADRLDDGGRRLCLEKPKLSNRPRSCGRRHAGVRESCTGAGKRPKGVAVPAVPPFAWLGAASKPAGLGIPSPLRPAASIPSGQNRRQLVRPADRSHRIPFVRHSSRGWSWFAACKVHHSHNCTHPVTRPKHLLAGILGAQLSASNDKPLSLQAGGIGSPVE